MRMVVVLNKDGSVSCLPVSRSRSYYMLKYNVLCFVNKMWNPINVLNIKKYFEKSLKNSLQSK